MAREAREKAARTATTRFMGHLEDDSGCYRLLRTKATDVVPAGRTCLGAQLAPQPDLTRRVRHAAGATAECNQRCESTLARRQVEASRVGSRQLFAILED